jgi:phage terminase large subunit-like protein
VTDPKAVPGPRELRERFAQLTPPEQAKLLRAIGDEDAMRLEADWGLWSHAGQAAPAGDWRTWVIMAGRGFGKTRAGAEWVRSVAAAHPGARIALIAASLEETRAVMVEGRSGLIEIAGNSIDVFLSSQRRLVFTNGAEATLFSGASPERLRGPEHHFAWCDELAKWRRPGETWDMLQLGLRLGDHPRALVTTTPRPGPVLRRIMESRGTVVTGGPTRANPHLPAAFVEAMAEQYAGTRLGRQELDGELLTDVEGALWTVELLERCRISNEAKSKSPVRPELVEGLPFSSNDDQERKGRASTGSARAEKRTTFAKTVIGVDPPASSGTCGIIVCARDSAGIAHVLADHSVTGRHPEAWARAVAAAAEVHGATCVVAERNQGGEMVRAVLRAADAALPVKLVHASIGKSARAEPVHTLFEARKVRLHGCFPELEAELRGLIAGGGYERVAWPGPGGPDASPDRADAMVWALTELMLGAKRGEPRVHFF